MYNNITKIALVDNELLVRQVIKSLIQQIDGFEVVMEAESGKDFIDQLKKRHDIDLALIDQSMAPMDGLETLAYLKKHQLLQGKCAILSIHTHILLIKAALLLGAVGWIEKNGLNEAVLAEHLRNFKQTGMFFSRNLALALQLDNKDALKDIELNTMKLLCTGKTNKEIADELYRGVKAVDDYIQGLLIKLGLRNRVELAIWAIKNGFCTP